MGIISLQEKTKLGELLSFNNIDLGAMIPITTTTLTTTTATITFSDIPQNYEHLQIRGFGRSNRAAVNDIIRVRYNGDTGSNYAVHVLNGDGSLAESFANTTQTYQQVYIIGGNNATSGVFGAFITDILDYSNTNKNKTLRQLGGTDNNGNGVVGLSSGLWMSTAAINSITITAIGSFLQYTSFALYGIKRAGA
jgi:hypothetical protein